MQVRRERQNKKSVQKGEEHLQKTLAALKEKCPGEFPKTATKKKPATQQEDNDDDDEMMD